VGVHNVNPRDISVDKVPRLVINGFHRSPAGQLVSNVHPKASDKVKMVRDIWTGLGSFFGQCKRSYKLITGHRAAISQRIVNSYCSPPFPVSSTVSRRVEITSESLQIHCKHFYFAVWIDYKGYWNSNCSLNIPEGHDGSV
jgi:hypothetical protein